MNSFQGKEDFSPASPRELPSSSPGSTPDSPLLSPLLSGQNGDDRAKIEALAAQRPIVFLYPLNASTLTAHHTIIH